MFPAFSERNPTVALARDSRLLGTYEVAELAQENIVNGLATLESTFGRSDGMLTKVLGTRLRGSE